MMAVRPNAGTPLGSGVEGPSASGLVHFCLGRSVTGFDSQRALGRHVNRDWLFGSDLRMRASELESWRVGK